MRKLRAVSITEDKKRVQRNCALYFLTTQGRAARMARVAGFVRPLAAVSVVKRNATLFQTELPRAS